MIVSSQMVTGSATERVVLGVAAHEAICAEAERAGAKRVFLMASGTLRRDTDEIDRIEQALGARHVGTASTIRAHGPKSDIVTVVAQALSAECDLVVAVGGSTMMDSAKIVSLALRHGATTVEALDALRMRYDAQGQVAWAPEVGPTVRVVCVPTTLSGGEFNTLSGAFDEALGQKYGYQHPLMAPVAIVLDPDIARHTPDRLWLSTGLRAIDHAVETLVSPYSNAYYDGLAESGLRLLVNALPRLKRDPADRDARLASQIGAWQAILPLVGGVPMGASHAIGHALGACCGIAHGDTSCVMASHVQRWNAIRGCTTQQRVSAVFGNADAPLGTLLAEFIAGLDLPVSLSAIDVGPEHYQRLAELTLHDIWGGTNVCPLGGADDVIEILGMAQGNG